MRAAHRFELHRTWRVALARPWLRRLAPLFRWNHVGVMRAGEAGLARWLSGQAASA